MKLFLDTASLEEIRAMHKHPQRGNLEGVSSNTKPS